MPNKIKKFQKRVHMRVSCTTYFASAFAFTVLALHMVFNVYTAHAAGLSFGYGASDDIVSGMLVSIDPEDTDRVVQANVNNSDYAVGVVVDERSSALVFDNNDSVYVATEGEVQAFVSTIGGDIEKGDLIVVSSIGGVGRKQQEGIDGQKIIGIAKTEFNEKSVGAETVELEYAGKVSIGLVRMEVHVGEPASGQADSDGTNVLVRIGRRLAGKPVSLSQVIITASVVIVTFVISGALLFGAIKGSFTSIGRNPLSAKLIYHGMARASLVSLGVMMLGIVAGYVVLLL